MTPKNPSNKNHHDSHSEAPIRAHSAKDADTPEHLPDHDNHNHDIDIDIDKYETNPVVTNTKGYQRTLLLSFIIITGYMFIEAVGGWLTGSLALLSDAGHMLSDAIALGATLMAFKIGEKAATRQKTFGYKRFEILVAGVNGATLVIIALMIFYEAIKRFNSPPDIATQGMLIIATIGMLVNILVAWLMHRSSNNEGHSHGSNQSHSHNDEHEPGHKSPNDKEHADPQKPNTKKPANLNMQSAYLHVLSDLMGSVAAIIAALLMIAFGWLWADAAASVIVAILILVSGYRVVRDSVHILMEGTPKGIILADIEQHLVEHEQVQRVHDLHVWSITSGLHALSCHVVVDGDMTISTASILIHDLEQRLQALGISHATIQVESAEHSQTAAHTDALVCDIATRGVTDSGHIGHSH